jgi:hypothetical protein
VQVLDMLAAQHVHQRGRADHPHQALRLVHQGQGQRTMLQRDGGQAFLIGVLRHAGQLAVAGLCQQASSGSASSSAADNVPSSCPPASTTHSSDQAPPVPGVEPGRWRSRRRRSGGRLVGGAPAACRDPGAGPPSRRTLACAEV